MWAERPFRVTAVACLAHGARGLLGGRNLCPAPPPFAPVRWCRSGVVPVKAFLSSRALPRWGRLPQCLQAMLVPSAIFGMGGWQFCLHLGPVRRRCRIQPLTERKKSGERRGREREKKERKKERRKNLKETPPHQRGSCKITTANTWLNTAGYTESLLCTLCPCSTLSNATHANYWHAKWEKNKNKPKLNWEGELKLKIQIRYMCVCVRPGGNLKCMFKNSKWFKKGNEKGEGGILVDGEILRDKEESIYVAEGVGVGRNGSSWIA